MRWDDDTRETAESVLVLALIAVMLALVVALWLRAGVMP